jgi:hypothetical protein
VVCRQLAVRECGCTEPLKNTCFDYRVAALAAGELVRPAKRTRVVEVGTVLPELIAAGFRASTPCSGGTGAARGRWPWVAQGDEGMTIRTTFGIVCGLPSVGTAAPDEDVALFLMTAPLDSMS